MRFWSDNGEAEPTRQWRGAVPLVLLVLLIGLGSHSSKNALAPAAPLLEAEGLSPLLYSLVAASPQLGAIVAPVLWGHAYTGSERLVQVLVPLGDLLGQLVLCLGFALADEDSILKSQVILTSGLVIFSVSRAGVGVVQHAAMARLLHGKRLLLGFVVMIFFGHLVVAACNWSVPRILRSGLLALQLCLLLPNVLSVAAAALLAAFWSKLPPPSPFSPPRAVSPNPSVLSLPLLDESDSDSRSSHSSHSSHSHDSPGSKPVHCTMSASYDCCHRCREEKLQSRRAIWLLGVWRATLLGLLHAFQSITNDLLVAAGKTRTEAGSVVAMNQLLAMSLMPVIAIGGHFLGLRSTLVAVSLLPCLGALALTLPVLPWALEAGLLAIAVASTVMPVLPLVLVPANSRSCGKSFGLLDSLFGVGQATFTIALGALRKAGGFDLALPFLCLGFAGAAALSTAVAAVVRV